MTGFKMIYLVRIMLTIMALGWMFIIFGFSNQKGEDSAGLSEKVSYRIVKTGSDIRNEQVSESELWQRAKKIEYTVRKLAHMSEYAIMAMLWFLAIISYGIKRKAAYIAPVLIVFLYACTDEIHQLFIDDRSGKFTDVLIDTSGALLMMLVIFAVKVVIRKFSRNVSGDN